MSQRFHTCTHIVIHIFMKKNCVSSTSQTNLEIIIIFISVEQNPLAFHQKDGNKSKLNVCLIVDKLKKITQKFNSTD